MTGSRTRVILRRLAFIAFSAVIAAAIVETVFTTFYYFHDGRHLISNSEKMNGHHPYYRKGNLNNRPASEWGGRGDCLWADALQTHPYTGYVTHSLPPCGKPWVNNRGFEGDDYPIEKKPGTYVILLTGGSVAEQLLHPDANQSNWLQSELNKHFTTPAINKFVVLSGALGAWHQPQQLIQYALNSRAVDAVITLDGFNEITNFREDYMLEQPVRADVLGEISNAMDFRRVFCSYFEMAMFRWFSKGESLLSRSRALFYSSEGIRARLQACVNAPSPGEFNPYRFPKDFPEGDRAAFNLERYAHYIRLMSAIAHDLGAKSLHLIQPVPSIGKPLTPEERQVAGDLSKAAAYSQMTSRLLELNREKIPVISLLDTFDEVDQPIYIDDIHVNATGARLLQQRVLALMESQWGLKRHN